MFVGQATPAVAVAAERSGLLKDADRAYHERDFDRSISLYEQALQENPRDIQALQSLGVTYGEKGLWEKAAEMLEKARTLDPQSGELNVDLALAYAELKNFSKALEFAQKAVANSKTGNAYHVLGLIHEGLGDNAKALEAYEKGLAIDPSNSDLRLTVGNFYGKQKSLDLAIKAYDKAIQNDPKNSFAYSNAGYAYQQKGDLNKAAEYFQKATEVDPKDAVAWYDLGSLKSKQGNYDEAIANFLKSLALDAESYKANLSLAMAYEAKRELEKSAEFYTKAMTLTDDPVLKDAILKQITRSGD